MTTVEISLLSNASGEKGYRAVSGDSYCEGKTAGQALDALLTKLGEPEFSRLVVTHSADPDLLFTDEQQERLAGLMLLWQEAKEQGRELPPEQKSELEALVEAELQAEKARTAALMKQETI